MTGTSGEALREIEITDEYGDHRTIHVPVERSLSVRLNGREIATLWTLGARPEWLVLGYLRNRQLVRDVTQLASVGVNWSAGTASILMRPGRAAEHQARESAVALGDLPAMCRGWARISRTTLQSLLASMEGNDAIYRAAGSVQGCALFQGRNLWLSVEDVSRRNSFDIITGWMALHGVSGSDKLLFTTGRLTAEVVIKAADNGIPILVSRKGVTSACLDLAARLGMTLIGHASRRRYICYAGAERFDVNA